MFCRIAWSASLRVPASSKAMVRTLARLFGGPQYSCQRTAALTSPWIRTNVQRLRRHPGWSVGGGHAEDPGEAEAVGEHAIKRCRSLGGHQRCDHSGAVGELVPQHADLLGGVAVEQQEERL